MRAETMCDRVNDICDDCGSKHISREPTPFNDEDGTRIVVVYRCLNCGVLNVPDFDEAA